jgi:hypothetical protein
MSDFLKIFTSCGKVTSLTLSVNAISAENSAHGRLFTLSDSGERQAASFPVQSQLTTASAANLFRKLRKEGLSTNR